MGAVARAEVGTHRLNMDPLLHTRALAVGHGTKVLIAGTALELRPGTAAALIGANGTGKSTLLRTLAGLHRPIAGNVFIAGADLATMSALERARQVGIVLTGRPPVGGLTVEVLVGLGRQPWTGHLGRLGTKDRAIVEEALARTGAADLAPRALDELSDGECQKVMIARALAQQTPVLLLDEPTAFLDLTHRVRTIGLLREIARGTGRAVLFSTHDLQLAMDLTDSLLIVRNDRTLWSGTPQEAVSSGVLAATFNDTSVRFDPSAGTFRAR